MNTKLTEKELLKDIKAYKKTFYGDFACPERVNLLNFN